MATFIYRHCMAGRAARSQHHGTSQHCWARRSQEPVKLDGRGRASAPMKKHTESNRAMHGQAARYCSTLRPPQQHCCGQAQRQAILQQQSQLPKPKSTRGSGPAPARRWRRQVCERQSTRLNLSRRHDWDLALHGAGVIALHVCPVHDVPPEGQARLGSGARRLACIITFQAAELQSQAV